MAQRVLVIGMRELFEYMWVLGRSMDTGLARKVVLCKVLLEMFLGLLGWVYQLAQPFSSAPPHTRSGTVLLSVVLVSWSARFL